jgi:hypothetical protein
MTDVFFFPFHKVQDEYPKNSVTTQFGNGYSFASAPIGPPQIMFHLDFPTMFWFTARSPDGPINRTFSPSITPGLNLAALVDFYEAHQLYNTFMYPHPTRGNVITRFSKPLITPKNLPQVLNFYEGYWGHMVEPFQIDLILQPT